MCAPFLSGLKLSEAFYREIVGPLLAAQFPQLSYAAALIGAGSEILGFDDIMSTDHHYGPRVMLFLGEEDFPVYAALIQEMLARRLPYTFHGYPTNFTEPDPNDHGTQLLQAVSSGPVNHRVEAHTVRSFFQAYLGADPSGSITPADWLTFPQQKLLASTRGAVYHDDVGLEAMRERLAWYPHDLWRYLLAAAWSRIGQEEHLMGRAGFAGDEVGSALIGARLVRDIMRLCFLIERTYAPYPKWFGSAFRQLKCGPALLPTLEALLHAQSWQAREAHLVIAYERLAQLHNGLNLTREMPAVACDFFGRPFKVMALHGFSEELLRTISDPAVQAIAHRPPIGNIDLISDNTDLLEQIVWRPALRALYA